MDHRQLLNDIQKMADEYKTITGEHFYSGYRQAEHGWCFYFADVNVWGRAKAYNHMRQTLRYAKQRYANKIGK